MLIFDHKVLELLQTLSHIVESHVSTYTSFLGPLIDSQSNISSTQLTLSIPMTSIHMVFESPSIKNVYTSGPTIVSTFISTGHLGISQPMLGYQISFPFQQNFIATTTLSLFSTIQATVIRNLYCTKFYFSTNPYCT